MNWYKRKRQAEGTPEYTERAAECSAGFLEEFEAYVKRTREKLRTLPRSSKQWWKLSRFLAAGIKKASRVPALKRTDGTWARKPVEKAELFLEIFTQKYKLPDTEHNLHSSLEHLESERTLPDFVPVRARTATKLMKELDEESSTGPDSLATRLLKRCSSTLGRPVAKLTRLLLDSGRWPEKWRLHWILPLYKKRSVYDPGNYRGIHLSAQLSKVVERLVAASLVLYLEDTCVFGLNPFAYRKERSCKDALAMNAIQWIWWLHLNKKVALYCSDVSGAFDKVSAERLGAKLRAYGVRGKTLAFLLSWLEERVAVVVLNGSYSKKVRLTNMVYQGTVLGPPLWNLFFADVALAVRYCNFLDTLFSDDLNCYKDLQPEVPNTAAVKELEKCQERVHLWGKANQVEFDSSKESFHVLHRSDPYGEDFKVLGVLWDTKLNMEAECEEVGKRAYSKVRALLKLRKYYTEAELVRLYKIHVLPVLEFPTPAVYHATTTVLQNLDKVQRHFLRELKLTAEQPLEE